MISSNIVNGCFFIHYIFNISILKSNKYAICLPVIVLNCEPLRYHKIFPTYSIYRRISRNNNMSLALVKGEENIVKQKKLFLVVSISFAYQDHIISNTATQLKMIKPLFMIYFILHLTII